MTVQIHRDLDLRVPENIAEGLDVHTILNRSCGKGVPERMLSVVLYTCSFTYSTIERVDLAGLYDSILLSIS